MTKFKTGDKVIFLGSHYSDHKRKFNIHQILTIKKADDKPNGFNYIVEEDPEPNCSSYFTDKHFNFYNKHLVTKQKRFETILFARVKI